jgi:ribose transport system permease protein
MEKAGDSAQQSIVSSERTRVVVNFPIFLLALYLLCIYLVQPNFFMLSNLGLVLYYTCLLVPAVVGVYLLMIIGLFDLSVGAVAAVAGVVVAKMLHYGFSIPTSIFLALLTGAVFGFINWILISRARIPALIATLITLGAARAFALAVTQGQVVGNLPSAFGDLALGTDGALSPAVVFGLILVLTIEVLMQRHIIFRRLYHVGSSRTATALCGINVARVECLGLVACSLGAALVGILQSSRTLSASPLVFQDLALECIAACIIGGTSLFGGSGRVGGAFLGMLMVVVSRNLVVLAGVNVYWRELGVALVLLAAVLVNKRESR